MASSNPYIGPRSFLPNETIYGRDRELRQLTDRLIAERIVLLHAPSGAGKTSLIQAGLLPRMRDEGFHVYPIIRISRQQSAEEIQKTGVLPDLHSFNRYVFSTLLSLEEAYAARQRMKIARLARMSLQNYLAFRSIEDEREGPELMIFDQFEEILTLDLVDVEAKKTFFAHLGTLLKNRNRWALFSMRTDYVGALEPYVRNFPTNFSNTFHLDLLSVKSAQDAIQKPAKKLGVTFADPAAQKLVDDLRRVQVQLLDGTVETQLGNQIEPVQLQVVCYRIWEGKEEDDSVIDETDLAAVGDVNNSLAEYYAASIADTAKSLEIQERIIREWFSEKLITPDGARSQARLGPEGCEGLPLLVVYALENTHLIRSDKRAGQTWYELTHDRLLGPVHSDNQKWFDEHLSVFQRQAALWAKQGFSEGLLLRSKELDEAILEAASLELTPQEKDFLDACLSERRHEERDTLQRRFILAGLVFSLLFLILSISGFTQATFQRNNAESAATSAIEARKTSDAAKIGAEYAKITAEVAKVKAEIEKEKAFVALTQAAEQQATAQAADKARLHALETQAAAVAEAAQARLDANEQAEIAEGNNLVSLSVLERVRDPQIAALLAIEAYNRVQSPIARSNLLSFIPDRLARSTGYNTLATTAYVNFSLGQEYLVHSSYTQYNLYDASSSVGGVVKTRRVDTGQQIGAIFAQAGLLDAVVFSPDGSLIATASCMQSETNSINCERETITLWDAATQTERKTILVMEDFRHSQGHVLLAFSSDGNTLAAAVKGVTIKIWDVQACLASGDDLCSEKRFNQEYSSRQLAFVPATSILVFFQEQQIIFLDVASGEVKQQIKTNVSDKLFSLALSPDSELAAAGTVAGDIFIWRWKTAEPVRTPLSYVGKADVTSLAFSPDVKTLVAGYEDHALILWDVDSSHQLLRPYFRHSAPVLALAFRRDGKMFASAGDFILLWDMDPTSWITKACEFAGRNFTQEEWKTYFPADEYAITCPRFPASK